MNPINHPPLTRGGERVVSRRKFLKGIAVATACFSPVGQITRRGTLSELLASLESDQVLSACILQHGDVLQVNIWSKNILRRTAIRVASLPHSFAFNPKTPLEFAAISKLTSTSSICRLDTGQVEASISSVPDYVLSGHGAYSPCGKYLFATEFHPVNQSGLITIRDTLSYRVVEQYSIGKAPHELRFIDSGRLLAVGSRVSRRSALLVVEPFSGRVEEEYCISDPEHEVRHFALGSNGHFLLASYTKGIRVPASLFWGRRGTTQTKNISAGIEVFSRVEQFLSTALDPAREIVGVTAVGADYVSFWELHTGRLLRTVAIDRAQGIAPNPSNGGFWVNTAAGDLISISGKELEICAEESVFGRAMSGAHLSVFQGRV